jgi:hypothetical protein
LKKSFGVRKIQHFVGTTRIANSVKWSLPIGAASVMMLQPWMTGNTIAGNVCPKMHNLGFVFLQIPPEIHDEKYKQQVHISVSKFIVL